MIYKSLQNFSFSLKIQTIKPLKLTEQNINKQSPKLTISIYRHCN